MRGINTKKSTPAITMAASGIAIASIVPGALAAQEDVPANIIEEITVTAQKRQQSQQDVPIALAAFTSEMVEEAGGVNITGINGIKPNIILQTEGLVPNVPMFSIRGMNHSDPDPNSDPKISTVIDGVYVPFVAGALLDLFDIEQVEVLRGPQGTLFGKNNLAGTVSVVTSRPTGEFGGSLRASVGSYGYRQVRAKINSSRFGNNKFAAKLSLNSRDYDGYSKNLTTGTDLGQQEVASGRFALRFEPSDTFDATLIVDHTEDEVVGPAGYGTGISSSDVRDVELSFDPVTDTESTGVTLEANWDLGQGTLTGVFGHRELAYYNRGDFDGMAFPLPGLDVTRDFDGEFNSIEIRYASSFGDGFDYVAGLYHIDDEWKQDNYVRVNPVVATQGTNQQDGASYAAFFQGDIHLAEAFTLTIGGRYSRDEKDYALLSSTLINGNAISTFVAPKSDTWSNFSPRLAVEYSPGEDIMFYASISEGYKGGGYNSRGTLPENIGPYDEENVRAYEVGMKSDWLDGSLRVNAALFLNRFEDLQASVKRQGAARVENVTTNVASAETSGVEIEITALPIDNLQVGFNVAYLDARYDEFFDDVSGDGVATDNTHLDLANAPEVSASVLLDYDMPLGDAGTLKLHADWRYTKEYNTWGRSNDEVFVRPNTTLFNANVSFVDSDDRYKVSLYGRNLTDKEVISGAVQTGTNPAILFYQPPREVGVELTYNF